MRAKLESSILALYREKRWDESALLFEEVLTIDPNDGPSKLYLDRTANRDFLASLVEGRHVPKGPRILLELDVWNCA